MISAEMKLELSKLEQSAMIELYEVDLRSLKDKNGMNGELYRFYAGTNEMLNPIVWQGNTYQPFGANATGFSMSGQGPSNRPQLTLANFNGFVNGIVNRFDQCLGGIVRRWQVYVQYLDAVNFKDGNDKADSTQGVLTFYVIEQLSTLKRDIAVFTLALPTETDNALISSRTIGIHCGWLYRSAECGYTGGPVADEKDNPTRDPKKDKCSCLISGCKLRNNTRNYGGFVSVNKIG
ncbi:TPA: phage minor tail protein L [Pasteurella multocida]|uniref:phage minor tail protein L n=1 Tax=Pasteurella multocida TaxID=747 RepID=UPI00147CE444|nr:phage minor tail protein L [Pasteurella multocida]NNI83510.1 phage minor tail protein L [Pasteurella multocida]HDR1452753.1 phage minor tail protein L [Pasteurella multocida]HDR1459189.1 phage minor tail protein L [Pasteurella multocida]HDR1461534.1 phage minor tail protein L [Pasteurella multocida]HDR1492082.1 phage minor tail protein L [Pasteurella multocida]